MENTILSKVKNNVEETVLDGKGFVQGYQSALFSDTCTNEHIANESAASYNRALERNGYWSWG